MAEKKMPTLEDVQEAIAILDDDQPDHEDVRYIYDCLPCGHSVALAMDGSESSRIEDGYYIELEDCCRQAIQRKFVDTGILADGFIEFTTSLAALKKASQLVQQMPGISGNPQDHPEVIVCAGPPLCNLEGNAACKAALDGCPLCKHIVCHPDGSETEYQVRAH